MSRGTGMRVMNDGNRSAMVPLLFLLNTAPACTSFEGLTVEEPECTPAEAPPRPLISNSMGTTEFVVAMKNVDLGEKDDERGTHRYRNMGYDLDGVCTGLGAGPSCQEPGWATADHTDGP